MVALCSARSARRGHAARKRRRPDALTLRQKSTCSVCSVRPCAATATSVRLVTRAQFSRRSVRRRGQHRSSCARQSSVTWPHPDSLTDARLGHLRRERGNSGLQPRRWGAHWPGPPPSSPGGRCRALAVYRAGAGPSECEELTACDEAARI